jgi:predicted Zn finger-like uncharacterized protein
MNLATRCTACGTVFRVVQDQLKVSDGWVRCGRCGEVFNATEGLFDLDRDAPPSWPAAAETGTGGLGTSLSGHAPLDAVNPAPGTISGGKERRHPAAAGMVSSREDPASDREVDRMLDLADGVSAPIAPTQEAKEPPAQPASVADAWHRHGDLAEDARESTSLPSSLIPSTTGTPSSTGGFADARFNTRLFADDETAAATPSQQTAADAAPPSSVLESSLEGPSPDDAPATAAFLVQAERAARWRRPWVHAALGVSAVALTTLLAGQVGVHFRDQLAATEPALRQPLETLCATVGCRIGAPLRIDALSVDSSTIAQATNGTGYRLSVTLRNRAPHPVATPALDLTLTDANGQPIARRVIAASDFGAQAAVLKASIETPLQVWLSAGGAPVAGYTIELFYP